MTITPPALRSKTPNSVAHGGRLSSKVLAAIVRRPSGSQIGGGAVAGRELSKYIAQLTPIDCVEMSIEDGTEAWEGNQYLYSRGYSIFPNWLRQNIPLLRDARAQCVDVIGYS